MTDPANQVDITDLLDYEILRAQTVNCVLLANELLQEHNQQLNTQVSFLRIAQMHVVFLMQHNFDEEGQRIYVLKLLSAEGSQAQLQRRDAEGELVALDALDSAFSNAIGQRLAATVGQAYEQVVGPPIKPTHPNAPVLLQ